MSAPTLALPLVYTASRYQYRRRRAREVQIGSVAVGGNQPIRVQSMTTTRTQDLDATVAQTVRLVDVGCEIVRITAPTVTDAKAIGEIRRRLRARGIQVPLVADIHFSPAAALEAAEHVEKVRINPGNFADQKLFRVREYENHEYRAELERIEERFTPLVRKCKQLGVAMRIGSNHGSLSDRILNRFGDTPRGMVESALEFVRIAARNDYHDIVLSMKASNAKVMIQAYRLLVARMDEEGLEPYPLHLGVTEAGLGEDGRIKSAVGIGALLDDGLGDTVRVSLTEEPEAEIPVAQRLVAPYDAGLPAARTDLCGPVERIDPYDYARRPSRAVSLGPIEVGTSQPVAVLEPPEAAGRKGPLDLTGLVTLTPPPPWWDAVRAYRARAAEMALAGDMRPLHLAIGVPSTDEEEVLLRTASALGSLLCDGLGDSVGLAAPLDNETRERLLFGVLQGSGARITRTEYVSCPSCGRTLFDLQATTERIRSKTSHLQGVKIAIMGCVVNGPGEMADADFGYVGGSPGHVNLYVGKDLVERTVPEAEADERLAALIRQRGRWAEPPEGA
ncbi:MAG: (E)-4-hydroxy-3-methylbut-2-enyl-diphosphate synthase [Chloroflexi bacterium]|nr:(E)-4-hydroxy-3-methylbut-2-enyl-diphosphate synthase [Chloroflexota bacterium]